MTVYVADIASYQAGLVPAELRPACAGLWVKATQGSGYNDPLYPAWLRQGQNTGLILGAYHYPDSSPAAAQAQNLAEHILDTSLPVMVDEEAVGLNQALAVADAFTAAGLHPRALYLSRQTWKNLGSPDLGASLGSRKLLLINAAYPNEKAASPEDLYPGDDADEWAPYGSVTPSLWQFAETAALAGQRIDVAAYRGSATQLAAALETAAPPAASSPGESPARTWPTQNPGATGPFVELLQRALMLAGFDPHGVDGRYGHDTGAALAAAQRAFRIQVDGVCGPITWSRLRARTLAVQQALTAAHLGAGGLDSTAGALTALSLQEFQRTHRLLVDGLCGAHTSRALGIAAL